MQQNLVKCIIMPLPQLSYIHWLIYFKYIKLVLKFFEVLANSTAALFWNSFLKMFLRILFHKILINVKETLNNRTNVVNINMLHD